MTPGSHVSVRLSARLQETSSEWKSLPSVPDGDCRAEPIPCKFFFRQGSEKVMFKKKTHKNLHTLPNMPLWKLSHLENLVFCATLKHTLNTHTCSDVAHHIPRLFSTSARSLFFWIFPVAVSGSPAQMSRSAGP
uniref:Uncharacterized protein n=1 Tax=Anguilla anguilla TaxID=7936 RepID=A0A0E9XRU9_ANGAN